MQNQMSGQPKNKANETMAVTRGRNREDDGQDYCRDALPQELRIWVTSHNPGTATVVAELIESYDWVHSPLEKRVRTHNQDHRPSSRPLRKDSWLQGKQKSEGSSRTNSWENKPLSEIFSYKCNKKRHIAKNCTAKVVLVQKETEKIDLFHVQE